MFIQKVRLAVLSACLGVSAPVMAQLSWPAVTATTRPWTRWWWPGNAVDTANLRAAMESYKAVGLGGLEIVPIYGAKGYEDRFVDFLSPQWMGLFAFTLGEAGRLDMGIDLTNGTGWPFGGPWVTPADACKDVEVKTWTVKGGAVLKEPVVFVQAPLVRTVGGQLVDIHSLAYPVASNKGLQAYAFDQVRYEKALPLLTLMAYDGLGKTIDLTSRVNAAGLLDWTAPQGDWTLYGLFLGWHGKQVERAAPGGEGDVIDHFNSGALRNYLLHFDQAFAHADLLHLRAFFNDSYEVDDARGQSDWTPGFFAAFVQKRGYDLRLELPALLGKDVADKNRRVLRDYRQTISELLLEQFTRPWHSWAVGKGKLIRNQSHGSPANILDLYGAIDIPETEGKDILRFKFATSAAHVMGKPLASSESATWLNEHFRSSLGDVKQSIDKYFLGGVNHIFYHGTCYSPQEAAWPGWLFYAAVHFQPVDPFWKDFGVLNDYVARCQSFLQQGKPDNDVLLYFPFDDRNVVAGHGLLNHFDGMEGYDSTVFKRDAAQLLDWGYGYDLISDLQLQGVRYNGQVLGTGGVAYQTIVLPAVTYLPLETWSKVVALARAGATVVVHGHLPLDVPGYGHLLAAQASFKEVSGQLVFAGGNGVREAKVGSGRVLLGDDLRVLLDAARVRRETVGEQGLQFVRRRFKDGHVYLLVNTGKAVVNGWVSLEAKEGHVLAFDAMTGVCGVATTRQVGGRTQVFVELDPGASVLLQTTDMVVQGAVFPLYEVAGLGLVPEGPWGIHFVRGGPVLPADATVAAVQPWTGLLEDGVKAFSGTAVYSVLFKRPVGSAVAWQLDLGRVEKSAEVRLNGQLLGTLLGPVFRLVIPASALLAENRLEVVVSNGMANRIADMDKNGVIWKKFYNANIAARLPADKGADGFFTAAGWEPEVSGLVGPVTLVPLGVRVVR